MEISEKVVEYIKYAVVILNFRTANDAINAAKSVAKHAQNDKYKICIIDGGSNSDNDTRMLSQCDVENTEVLFLDENKGYAGGNNAGIRFLTTKYNIQYIVVMNPDVMVVEKATIEDVICEIERDDLFVGGQPLVVTEWKKQPANEQINIRRVFSYFDCVVESFHLFKKIFARRYKRYVYLDKIPYVEPIKYEVPSGAFFVIKRSFFEKVGLFDEKTFLYNEEPILGHKIKNMGKSMVLVPKHKVLHESGKSIGSNPKRVSRFAFKENQKSLIIYMRDYLKVNRFQVFVVLFLGRLNFSIKEVKYFVLKSKI